MSETTSPASGGRAPGFPNNPQQLVFDGFEGINTKPSRPGIQPEQAWVCDGFMPFGKNNARTLYGVGSAVYNAPSGKTIVMHWFGNIGTKPICVVFLDDGGVVQVDLASPTFATTTIAAAGTITSVVPTAIGVSQWGSKYIIILSTQTNGYFLWDGALLYKAGTLGPDTTITSGGYNYTSAPTATVVGGTGSGASVSVTVSNGSVSSITVTNPGTGYSAQDNTYIAFTGGGGNTTARGTAVVSGGSITSITIAAGGTGYTSTASAVVVGGTGYGAVLGTVTTVAGAVTAVSVTAGGQAYSSSPPPTVIITDANNPVARATAAPMPYGVSGSAVETFQSQVWVANGTKVLFTQPSSASSFNPALGGGAFQSYDSFLKTAFVSLRQSNGFLYLLADSSMNSISGVQTSGSPPITTFTNNNVDPQIGTSWPGSVQVFSRNIVFANSFGVHASYGGAVTKVSDALDGIYASVAGFGGLSPSSAVATIFGIHVYMLLLPILDQVTGQQTNKLMMWDGKRWWTASQEINLTWIASQEINSVLTAYGTDGASIYPLFQTPSTALTKTLQSKLFDTPGYFFNKVASRIFYLVDYKSVSTKVVALGVDNGSSNTGVFTDPSVGTLTWTNDRDQPIIWTNSSGVAILWGRQGLATGGFAITQPGPLIGMTLQTKAQDLTVLSVTTIVQVYQTLL